MCGRFREFSRSTGLDIYIELGLQSSNVRTLLRIRRGHTPAQFVDAAVAAAQYGIPIGVHVILNLPGDGDEDVREAARLVSALGADYVKLHSLCIMKQTDMARQYMQGEIDVGTPGDYARRAALFLSLLRPRTAVARLASRTSEESALFCNWGMSWWRLRDMIEEYMLEHSLTQGCLCDYLDGSAWRRKFAREETDADKTP